MKTIYEADRTVGVCFAKPWLNGYTNIHTEVNEYQFLFLKWCTIKQYVPKLKNIRFLGEEATNRYLNFVAQEELIKAKIFLSRRNQGLYVDCQIIE